VFAEAFPVNNQIEQCIASDGVMDEMRLGRSGTRWCWKHRAGALLLLAASFLPVAAWAGARPDEIQPPNNMGVQMVEDMTIDWTAVPAGSGGVLKVDLGNALTVDPADLAALGCSLNATILSCPVATGIPGGTLTVPVRGLRVGTFTLVATGDDANTTTASNSGSIIHSGDLSVTKTKVSPVGNAIAGGMVHFELKPRITGIDSDVPAGATIVVKDKLPGGQGQFAQVTATSSGGPAGSCQYSAAAHEVVCTYAGPFSAASFNNTTISVAGKQMLDGDFINQAEIYPESTLTYLDRVNTNNTDDVQYTTERGTDIEALVSPLPGPYLPGNQADVTISFRNNGPVTSTNGVVQAVIPDGMTIVSVPAGCSMPVPNVPPPGQLVVCRVADVIPGGTLAPGQKADFPIKVEMPPLTNPNAPQTGTITVKAIPDSSLQDADPNNNDKSVDFTVHPPIADLSLTKAKQGATGSPLSGPQVPGTTIRTELTIRNENSSSGDLRYSRAEPLQVVDFVRPEEIKNDQLSNVTDASIWVCTVSNASGAQMAQAPSPNHTKMVVCKTTGPSVAAGPALASDLSSFNTLVRDGTLVVRFDTTIADMAPNATPVTLNDKACTGTIALDLLGVPTAGRPYPADSNAGNDCREAGGNLVGTPVGETGDSGAITINKTVSKDGVAATAIENVTLSELDNNLYWHISITRGTEPGLLPIPTLNLTDAVPGIVNLPHLKTPAIAVLIEAGSTGYASHNCPATIAAGQKNLSCAFKDVQPGAVINIRLHVQRELGVLDSVAGTGANRRLVNTASLSSPDAVLTGRVSDSAAAEVAPRLDVAISNKTVNPSRPAIGQPVKFTITATNRGPYHIYNDGEFTVVDDFYTGTADMSQPSYDLTGTPAQLFAGTSGALQCTTQANTPSANYTRVSCTNTQQIDANSAHPVVVNTRVLRPALNAITHPVGATIYDNPVAKNSASAVLGGGLCEWRADGDSVSAACNDPSAQSNNRHEMDFQVTSPDVDLEQGKIKVVPNGQRDFRLNDVMTFRFTLRNNGPTRAEKVVMTDYLLEEAIGYEYQLLTTSGQNYNVGTLPSGYTRVARNASCALSSSTGPGKQKVECTLSEDHLDAKEQVDFELRFKLVNQGSNTATASNGVPYGNIAVICSAESNNPASSVNGYEKNGWCGPTVSSQNNNAARVNGTLFPWADLTINKDTNLPAGQTAIEVGEAVPYVITLVNNDFSDAGGSRAGDTVSRLRMVDTLPKGFVWLTTPGKQPTAAANGSAAVNAPLTVSAGVPAAGTGNVCFLSGGSAQITNASQHQEVTCDLHGTFPTGAANSVAITLWAMPVPGVYTGPFNLPVKNTAKVSPGLDGDGQPTFDETVTTNNEDDADVPVIRAASIAGRVFVDVGDDGDQHPGDAAIGQVTVKLTGTDAFNNPIALETQTDASGDYLFAALPPSNAAGYTIVQVRGPTTNGYDNGLPQPNTPRTHRNGISTGVTPAGGSYAVGNTPTQSSIAGVVIASGADGVQFDFPKFNGRSIGGFVFADRARDDIYVTSSIDTPIPSAKVELLVWNAGKGGYELSQDVQTNPDGSYLFTGLTPSARYALREELPATYLNLHSAVKAGTVNGAACVGCVVSREGTTGPAADVDLISEISLLAGNGANFNFGEVVPVSVSGTVFFDLNNNGVKEPGDAGIGGVDIRLTGTDDLGNAVDLPLQTNADGTFSFEGLRPGTYTLIEPTQPTGTAQGKTTAGQLDSTKGNSGTASNGAAPESSKITNIDLTRPGDFSSDNRFAEVPTNSGITGKVWMDANNDGVVDPGEDGIAGVEMELTGTDINGNPITPITVTTGADGSYSFLNLPPGEYKVVEKQQPAGTNDGKTKPGNIGGTPMGTGSVEGSATAQNPSFIGTITVGVGQVSVENNFGEVPAAGISGNVYNDSNDDGIRQPEEGGFANVTVELTGTDDLGNPVTLTATTDANGKYTFENLRPGTYVVTEPNQPAETLNGKTTAGSTGGTGGNPSTTTSEITGIVLKPGDKSVDNNFGEIGDSPDMLVSKSSNTVKFTVNNVATYTIRVRNGGQQASTGEYIVKDRLPAGLNLAEVPSGNGWTCSGAVGDARFECRSSEVVNAGATSTSDITVKVNVTAEAAQAGTVNNAVLVEGGGENEFRTPTTTERNTFEGDVTQLPVCDAAITQNVCRVPNEVQLSASVGGTVWYDIGSDDAFLDSGDTRLQSWIVELLDAATGQVAKTTTTAVDGSYRFGDVVPGIKWNIQFRDPASGVLWAWPVNQETAGGMGVSCDATRAISDGSSSACRITENGTSQLQVVLEAGQHLPQQSLPVDPSGVVYDAITRDPVPGSIVTLTPVGVCNGYDPKTAILNAGAGGYRVEGNAVSMTVGTSGYYQFMFGPAAPARCEFQLTVTPPGGYQFVSSLIPPQEGSLSPLGAAGTSHLVQPQADAPTGAVGTPTQYWLTVFAGSATAGIVHNHLPLDTSAGTGLVITKTGDRQTAEIGDTVQYSITVRQTSGSAMATVNIVDTLPRGFTYIDGTARVGGRALDEPFGKPGPRLGFNLGPINVGQQLVLTYRVRVGVGAQQGDGINRAQAHGCSITGGCIDPGSMTPVPGSVPSNQAQYRVRVTGGVFTEEACVLGKVFVDCNNNHVQDNEELGIPGVRLYFSNGTWVISDSEGKYSYCGLTPQSHTLKVDPSTLPAGSRLTTSSNRNLGDADSLFLDLKNGELHRADFIEGSCSNPLLEQVKARRTQGEVRAPETETGQSPLRFESKPARAPQQATDSANQRPIVHPRPNPPSASASQEVQP
jgi:uncharacterized repeat protein (TIGR01451 family)